MSTIPSGGSSSAPPTTTSGGSGATSTTTNSSSNPGEAIIQALGVGNSLPLAQLLSGLMTAASLPLTQMQAQVSGIQAEISAYGQLESALSTFQSALSDLASPTTYALGSGTSTNPDVLNVELGPFPTLGTYDVNVTQLAQGQTLVSAGQASSSTTIGSGTPSTVTITLGTTGGTLNSDGTYTNGTFTPNSADQPITVNIDSSNNTLAGIAAAINATNGGVTASIESDGSSDPEHLVLTSTATGQTQSMQVSVSGDPALQSLLSYDPTSATGQDMTQTNAAQNAALTINGLAVSSPTNAVNSLTGITLDLTTTGKTTVNVTNDTSTVQTDIDNFVNAYNTVQSAISSLTAYGGASGGQNGLLIGDSTTEQIQSQLQQIVSNALGGTGSAGLSNLSQIGVTFDPSGDGTLTVNDATLSSVLQSNPNAFQALFSTAGSTTDSAVTYGGGTSATQPGTYAIDITQAATQGTLTGSSPATLSGTAASQLTVTLDGTAENITVPGGPYASADALANAVQTAINGNSAFQQLGLTATVAANASGALTLTSSTYGSTSSVSVSGTGAAALFGSSGITGSTGTDVQGTIGGFAATGSGQLLTGAAGSPAAGLLVQVAGSQTGARGSVSYSLGYASQLNNFITSTLSSSGSIANATNNLNTQVTQLQQEETQFQTYLGTVQSNYETEFTALNAALAQMQTTSSYLQQLFNPTTSSNS